MKYKLKDGYTFTSDESLTLEVDYSILPDKIIKLSGYDEKDWEYLSAKPKGKKKATVLIGTLNKSWEEESLEEILKDSPLKFSGAWVREAYLRERPNYNNGSWFIGFPDPKTSRWRSVHYDYVDFPCLWCDDSERWHRSLNHVRSEWSASRRLCLLCESNLGTSALSENLDTLTLVIGGQKWEIQAKKI